MSEPASTTTPVGGTPTPATDRKAEARAETVRPVVVVEEEDPDDAALRRRRRRRRRRSLKSESPERRIRTFLLGLVIVLLILALTGAQVGQWLKDTFATVRGSGQFSAVVDIVKKFLRWEVIALLIAALILLYLQPGMEDQILRKLGLKKDRRSSRAGG